MLLTNAYYHCHIYKAIQPGNVEDKPGDIITVVFVEDSTKMFEFLI